MLKVRILLKTILSYLKSNAGVYVKPMRYSQIFEEMYKIRPRKIMEVGTWNGKRAEEMIQVASKFHNVRDIEYFGFDLFDSMDHDTFKHEVSKIPPSKSEVFNRLSKTGAQINLIEGYTNETMKNLDNLPKIDFIYIDGGHAEETVLNDWDGAKKLMHEKTTVIFDDYWHNRSDGPRVVIDSIDRKMYNVKILPAVDVFFNEDFGRLVISLVKVTKKS